MNSNDVVEVHSFAPLPMLPGALFLFRRGSLGTRLHGIMELRTAMYDVQQSHNLYVTRYRS